MRRGITPVVAVVLLLMMTVAAAGGAYAWFGQIQGEAQEDVSSSLSSELSIKSARCSLRTVHLALTNTGEGELSGSDSSLYLYESDQLVAANESVDLSAVSTPGSFSRTDVTVPAVMAPGTAYTVDIETGDGTTAEVFCEADRWWWQPANANPGADGNGQTVSMGSVTVDRDGWYKVSYGAAWDNDVSTAGRHYMRNWLETEGSTVTPSETLCYIRGRNEERGDRCSNSGTVLVNATEGDTITLRGERYAGSNGETVTAEDHFVYAHRVDNPVAQVWDTTGGQDYDGTTITVNLDSSTRVDPAFTFDAANDALQVDEDGTYRVYYVITNDDVSQGSRQTVHSWVRLNGGSLPSEHPVDAYSYLRNTGSYNHQTGVAILDLAAGDSLQLRQHKEYNDSAGASETMADMNWLLLEQLPGNDVLHVVESGGGQRISSGSTDSITFDTTVAAGDRFSHDTASQMTIQEGGWYEVSYVFGWDDDGGNGRHGIRGWIRKNGDTTLLPSDQRGYSRGCCAGRMNGIAANTVHRFDAGDTIELRVEARGGYADVVGNSTYLTITPLVP